jgi:multidrug efflux pump subunit AcrA (membrane-fusion protein)
MLFQAAGWFEPDPLPIRATALVDGVVKTVHVLEGQAVKQGEPLANLIDTDTALALRSAERLLEQVTAEHHMHLAQIPAVNAEAESVTDRIVSAEARLAELADRYARLTKLSEGTVSEQALTTARLAVDAQVAEIAALKSDHASVLAKLESIKTQSRVFDARIAGAAVGVEESRLAFDRTKIVSPVDGVVLELKAAPGQKKMLGMDDPDSATIAILFETGKLQARVDVPLADARGLVPGQPAIITSDFLPNAEFKGVVSRVVGAADLQRNTLQAKVRVLDPDPRLRPEMLCRVKFLEQKLAASAEGRETTSSARMVMIPAEALDKRSGDTADVWLVAQGSPRAERRSIALGSFEKEGFVSVTEGLLAGALVVLPPFDGLKEGRRITYDSDELR